MFTQIVFVACLIGASVGRPDRPSSFGYQPPELEHTYSQPQPQPQPTYSQPQPSYSQPQQSYQQEQEGMPFNFAFQVKDEYTGNDFSHTSDSDGHVTNGEYRVLLPDGRTQIVTYVADHEAGYNAEVTYEGEVRPYEAPQQNRYEEPRPSYSRPQTTYEQPKPQPTYQQPKPKPTYQQPTTQPTYQQPKPQQIYQPKPQPTYQQPQQTYERPHQTYEQPQQTYEEPQQTYEKPQQTYEKPQQTYEKPQQTYGLSF